jgi:hypothetical protein
VTYVNRHFACLGQGKLLYSPQENYPVAAASVSIFLSPDEAMELARNLRVVAYHAGVSEVEITGFHGKNVTVLGR